MIIAESLAKDLPSLPLHPAGLIWPTEDWPVGNMPSLKIQQLADEIFDLQGAQGVTHALLIFQAAKCCYEIPPVLLVNGEEHYPRARRHFGEAG